MRTRTLRLSPAAAELLRSLEGRTNFEKEYALQSFVSGIEQAMQDSETTQADLARKLGKSVQAISRALKGKQNLTVGTLVEIAVALGKTVDLSAIDLPAIQVATASKPVLSQRIQSWTTVASPTAASIYQTIREIPQEEVCEPCLV